MFASCDVLWLVPGTYPRVALYTSLPGLTYGHGSLALIPVGVSFGSYKSYHMLGGSELL